jgi:hypothetical protein
LGAGFRLSGRCPIIGRNSGGAKGASSTAALPVHGGEKPVTDQQRWIERNAAKARRALADPSVRAALLALLGGDDRSRRRERRIAAVRLELAGLEVRWPLLEEDERKP